MKAISNLLIAGALCLCLASNRVSAQTPGSADYTFASATANGPVFAVGTTSAGYIWMGGYFNSVDGSYHTSESSVSPSDTYFDLAVLNTNGALDASFEFPNYSGSYSSYFSYGYSGYYVSAIAIDSNDVVFVALNTVGGSYSSTIARFDPSGPGSWTLNGGFTAASKNQFTVIYSLAVDGSTVYVAGNYNQYYPGAGGYTGSLVPLDYNGAANLGYSLPPALVAQLYGSAADIYQVRYLASSTGFTNNSLLVCGNVGVGRISTSGTNVYASQLFGSGSLTCAATRPDVQQLSCPDTAGELIAGGSSCPYSLYANIDENDQIVDGFQLHRYGASPGNTLPVLDLTQGDYDYGLSRVDALPDGSMLVCGYFDVINGSYADNWAHLLQDGTVDENFANAANLWVFDMAAQTDGKYLLGGSGFYTEDVFGGEYGYVQRQYGISSGGGPLAFVTQPTPSNVVAYPGDFVAIAAAVTLANGVNFQWTQNGTNAPGQTGEYLYVDSVAASDAGTYQLLADTNSLCPNYVVSSNTILTVLTPPPPPPNDMFAKAVTLTGTNGVTAGYIRDSTEEPGEPDHANNSDGHSVWYNWTAPGSGWTTLTVYNNDFPAALAVYTGTAVDDLTLITNDACPYEGGDDDASSSPCDGVTGAVTFFAVGGTTYQIAVGGPFEIGSLDTFSLSLTECLSSGSVGPGVGTSWVQVYSNPDEYLTSVACGCGELVAGGYPPTFLTSSDASNWFSVNAGFDSDYQIDSINFGNGLFLAAGYGQIAVSTNAAQWNLENLALSNNYFYGTTYRKGIYVNANSDGTLMTSPDGTNWTVQATNAAANSYDGLYSVAYGHGLFVAVGDEGSVVTSPDGTNWGLAASYVGAYSGVSLYSITHGKGLFAAVGDDGTIVTSPDATNWTLQAASVTQGYELYAVAFGDGRFVAVGADAMIVLSTDGTNWVQDASGVSGLDFNGVAYYQKGRYVIVGDEGTILVNQLPAFLSVNNVPNFGLQVTLLGLSSATAVVEVTPTLSPPDWQPFLTNTFTNSTIIFTDTLTNQTKFYRALVR